MPGRCSHGVFCLSLLALCGAVSGEILALDGDRFARYLQTEVSPVSGFGLPMGALDHDHQGVVVDDAQRVHVDCSRVLWPSGPLRLDRNAIPCRQVRAVAEGRVLRAGHDEPVVVEHWLYENARKRRLVSVYHELAQNLVHPGDEVRRGTVLGLARPAMGEGAHPGLRFELCFADDDSLPDEVTTCGDAALPEVWAFIEANRKVPVPGRERTLVLVDRAAARLRLYRLQRVVLDTDVALGQGPGDKQRRGDLRTPAGMYFVASRSKGPFAGAFSEYYGGHWIKLNYPNAFDAAAGVERGLITAAQQRRIADAWHKRELTRQDTRLGGGIGFHGWAGPWDGSQGRGMSWGCIVLHEEDIEILYRYLEPGTMVVIF